MNLEEKKNQLVQCVSKMTQVIGIAQTGDITEIPVKGQGDYDLFVICTEIPDRKEREACYQRENKLFTEQNMEVCKNHIHWGTGDILMVDGVETMFMYFTEEHMNRYLDEVLSGERQATENGFYPIGRLATINQATILYEETDAYSRMKEKVAVYPDDLAQKIINGNEPYMWDDEDAGRAVLRKDVVFTHRVLQNALEHFLQVLYAVNRVYFPSWKRTRQYISEFENKPVNCYERIEKIIALSSQSESIPEAFAMWEELVDELKKVME